MSTTIDRKTMQEILAETMDDHGVPEELVGGVVRDAMERMEVEFDIEFEDSEDEEPEDD